MKPIPNLTVLTLSLSLTMAYIQPVLAIQCNPEMAASSPDANFRIEAPDMVTQLDTGLIWKKCVQGRSGEQCETGSPLFTSWEGALRAVQTANMEHWGGYADWRLPNVKELQSLVETRCFDPSINANFFPGSPADFFWTSTSIAVAPKEAWGVSFASGFVMPKNKKKTLGHVRLVRGGQASSDFDALGK